MRQDGLSFDVPHKQSYVQKVLQVFQANENVWVNADLLASRGGRYAWRTRISNLRKPPYNLSIENRQRKAEAGHVISEYRYVPK